MHAAMYTALRSAVARPIVPTSVAAVSIDHPQTVDERLALEHLHNLDLMSRASKLALDLASSRQRSATLLREIRRMLDAATVVSANVVDGMLTETLSTGAVRQRRLMLDESPTSFGYVWQWVMLEPVPGTPAAIAADALRQTGDDTPQYAGMAVVAGDDA